MSNRKFNASGMGANPKLNSAQLWNGPARPGGSQKATLRADEGGVRQSSNEQAPRSTPFNQHGVQGSVEPSAKQPKSANHPS
jgi:hypothetical protein